MPDAPLLAALRAKLDEIRTDLDEATAAGNTLNEAQTEFVILDPLLKTLGYRTSSQLQKRGYDTHGSGFPDYTLMPASPHQWFLEAKRLGLKLQHGEAAQAVNYANNQGASWAVLTNGRTWHFYLAHRQVALPDKLVLRIDDLFNEPDAVERLALLSRESMQTDALTRYWQENQAHQFVYNQLSEHNSNLRNNLLQMIRQQLDLSFSSEWLDQVMDRLLQKESSFLQIEQPVVQQHSISTVSEQAHNLTAMDAPSRFRTMSELEKLGLLIGQKPDRIRFEDGEEISLNQWAELARQVVLKLAKMQRLPQLPYSHARGKRIFLNNKPSHPDGEAMRAFKKADTDKGPLFVHTYLNAQAMCSELRHLIELVGLNQSFLKISIRT